MFSITESKCAECREFKVLALLIFFSNITKDDYLNITHTDYVIKMVPLVYTFLINTIHLSLNK